MGGEKTKTHSKVQGFLSSCAAKKNRDCDDWKTLHIMKDVVASSFNSRSKKLNIWCISRLLFYDWAINCWRCLECVWYNILLSIDLMRWHHHHRVVVEASIFQMYRKNLSMHKQCYGCHYGKKVCNYETQSDGSQLIWIPSLVLKWFLSCLNPKTRPTTAAFFCIGIKELETTTYEFFGVV